MARDSHIKPTLWDDGALSPVPKFAVVVGGQPVAEYQGDSSRDGLYANASALARAERHLHSVTHASRPTSFLAVLAMQPMAVDAIASARDLLGLPHSALATDLVDAAAWRRATTGQRLAMLESWLRAEIFAEIEIQNTPVPGPRPIDTVGTNDRLLTSQPTGNLPCPR